MKQNIVILAVLSVATLTACGSKTDANEKNFRAAMTKYFDKKGDLCLDSLDMKRWPVDVSQGDLSDQKTRPFGIANQMAALEAAGLVKGEDTEVDATGYFTAGGKRKVKRYTLTDAAKPFVQEKEIVPIGVIGGTKVKQIYLCWGKKALDKIVKWEGPKKFGDYQEALIIYTYKVNNLADWAKKPEVQAAFPSVKRVLDGVGSKESRHVVKLTSQGWEAAGLD